MEKKIDDLAYSKQDNFTHSQGKRWEKASFQDRKAKANNSVKTVKRETKL